MLRGDPKVAVATLDAAVKADPAYPRALFLRARAKALQGQTDAAIADYNLASRSAFAEATNLASGEAHLYRGIALYLRKDYARAEDEFSSALNFEIPDDLKPDAGAWRNMAAVAGGSCGSSREKLETALETASPYFPKNDARTLAFSCQGNAPAAGSTSAVR